MTERASGTSQSPLVPYILAGCTAVSTLSTDLFAPSVPHLPEALGTSEAGAQLAISVNLAAYAAAQLMHGPLADRFGRRSLLIGAFCLFAIASVACALATGINGLLGGRIAQGIFSSVPSVVVVLMIRELYGGARAVAVMALYGMAVGIAPAIGPLIGGYLHVWFGWTAGFWLIAALALAAVAGLVLLVPETQYERRAIRPGHVIATYARLMTRKGYLACLIPLSLTFGALFAFVTTGPLVFIDLLGVPTQRYGLCYAVIVVAYISGSLAANRIARQGEPLQMLRWAALIGLAAAATLLCTAALDIITPATILTGMAIYGVGLGLLMAVGPILMLDAVADMPQGPASALLGACQLGAGALAGLISGTLYDGTAISMIGTIAGFLVIAALPALLLRHADCPQEP